MEKNQLIIAGKGMKTLFYLGIIAIIAAVIDSISGTSWAGMIVFFIELVTIATIKRTELFPEYGKALIFGAVAFLFGLIYAVASSMFSSAVGILVLSMLEGIFKFLMVLYLFRCTGKFMESHGAPELKSSANKIIGISLAIMILSIIVNAVTVILTLAALAGPIGTTSAIVGAGVVALMGIPVLILAVIGLIIRIPYFGKCSKVLEKLSQ